MKRPKVSVLLITYNHGRHVREALESIFTQKTSFAFDVVVADDASTDDTRKIVDEFARRYPERMVLSYLERNAADGGATNTIRGLERCDGEYIAMLDGDDQWLVPDKLQKQVDYLDAHPGVTLCFHNCRIEYEEGGRKSWDTVRFLKREIVTTEDLLAHAMVQTSTIVMRRELVPDVVKRPDLLCDWFIGLMATQRGEVAYLEDVMSVFRQHAGSSFTTLSRARQWVKFMTLYEKLPSVLDPKYRPKIEEAICVRSYLAALEYEKERDFRQASRLLTRALQSDPRWLDSYCSCDGITGEQLLAQLPRRIRLYRVPLLFPLWSLLESVRAELRWLRLFTGVKLQLHSRYRRGKSVGYIVASPNPAPSHSIPGRAGVDLRWSSSATDVVEVRLGRPDGPLISRTGPVGGTRTGEWVSNGAVFYLQDVFREVPLTLDNTLDVVRIRVN